MEYFTEWQSVGTDKQCNVVRQLPAYGAVGILSPPRATEMVEQISGTFYTLVHKQSGKKSHFSDVYILQSLRHYKLSQMRFARKK